MKFDYSFVDLDYTLFDTRKLENEMWEVFSSYGVTHQDYDETYKQSLCTVSREYFDYSFEEHVDFLKQRGYNLDAKVVGELNNLLDKNHLFADSLDFINFLKSISNKTILLTAGDAKFQEEKIKHSEIENLFDEVVILNGHKDEYLRPILQNGYKILFVNDSWRENVMIRKEFEHLSMVGIDGPHGRKQNDGHLPGLDYVANLTQAKIYVSGLE